MENRDRTATSNTLGCYRWIGEITGAFSPDPDTITPRLSIELCPSLSFFAEINGSYEVTRQFSADEKIYGRYTFRMNPLSKLTIAKVPFPFSFILLSR